MARPQDTFLSGANIEFIEALYARYLENPASVDPSWRELFDDQAHQGEPLFGDAPAIPGKPGGNGHATAPTIAVPAAPSTPATAALREPPTGARATVGHQAAPELISSQVMSLQARVDQLIYAFRLRGHLVAQLDPLNRPRPALEHVADVGLVSANLFSELELDQMVDSNDLFPEKRVRVGDLIARLRRTYASKIGVELMTILDSTRRRWLMQRMELSENRTEFTREEQRQILTELSYAEGFESFLHTKYVGAKRFSIDGGEALIPMLDQFLQQAATLGIREVVIGMAHRGRLNVLTNILGKTPDQIFSEFEGPKDPKAFFGRGDVKYHMGFSSDYETKSGEKVHLSLSFNPSHLEAVNPVVVGRVRAKQDRSGDTERSRVVPVLIHGDAAFIGQGVVAETLNLSGLKAYTTGGTMHVVINNQVGFTTDPEDARSSMYCTALAQMLDIPIFHVNADDPEACVHVMRLAAEYRQTFKSDVVIDLVCFRRYGHNEGDEPAFTQPKMYEVIRARGTVREAYAKELLARGRISEEEAESIKKACLDEYEEAHARAKAQSQYREPSALEGLWKSFRGGPELQAPEPDTGVEKSELQALIGQITAVPEGFTAHPNFTRAIGLFANRQRMAKGELPLDWGTAENLAYATLLKAGARIRLTGQDTERGTFAHRNAVIHDVKTGARHVPLQHVSEKGEFHVFNSSLSEYGCMGFEYGYSLDVPDGLVIWEAQFGDFANTAQVIIDQFIAAGESKWSRLSGLTLLLPHGYEGSGPEHSSARLERFLSLCAEDNIQVCYPTTPAQIFHLLRRQVVRPLRKPLVVMTPKSLLRASHAASPLDELATGKFQRVIADKPEFPLEQVTRLLLCSGKVYFDLIAAREAAQNTTTAIVRLEQLYPFPKDQLTELLGRMPNLTEFFWVQEEPRNAGAWHFMFPRLHELVSTHAKKAARVGYIGRSASASPATGVGTAHELEQKLIVDEAIPRSA